MRTLYALLFAALLLVQAAPGKAAVVDMNDFSLEVPGGWDVVTSGFSGVPPEVASVLDCLDAPAPELKMAGWKLKGRDVLGAFCVSRRSSGTGKARTMLMNAKGREREQAALKAMNVFSREMGAGIEKRGLKVDSLSGDMIDAGDDVIMFIEGRVKTDRGNFLRHSTIILHGDGLLTVGLLSGAATPKELVEQLDAIPLSVVWKK